MQFTRSRRRRPNYPFRMRQHLCPFLSGLMSKMATKSTAAVSKSSHSSSSSLSVAAASLVLFLAVSLQLPVTSLAAQNRVQAQTIVKPTPFSVCIDDSDCSKLGQGSKYACFQYICYPWKNDNHIETKDRRDTCRKDTDCPVGQECYRHHDKRAVNRGLCFDQIHPCVQTSDCPGGMSCCGESCCEEAYFNQYKLLPCISDMGCEDIGLGKYCCPRANSTSVCCNTNPNPPPTPKPNRIDASAASAITSTNSLPAFTLSLVFVVLLLATAPTFH